MMGKHVIISLIIQAALLIVFFLNEEDSEIAHYCLIALPNYA